MENEGKEIVFKIEPEFNFLYEMGMPTGKKIRTSIIVGIIFVIASILLFCNKDSLEFSNTVLFFNLTMFETLKWIAIIAITFAFIRAILCTIIQKLSYDNVTYTFYDKFMIYEDNFLNQHKKTIQYENVKEVEIRRTVWDRILGYGIIVIYTSAENNKKNGMIIYSIKNVKEVYEKIEKLVHNVKNNEDEYKVKSTQENNVENVDNLGKEEEKKDEEKDFKDSLKNIK